MITVESFAAIPGRFRYGRNAPGAVIPSREETSSTDNVSSLWGAIDEVVPDRSSGVPGFPGVLCIDAHAKLAYNTKYCRCTLIAKVIVFGNIRGDIAAYVPKWIRTSVDEADGARPAYASTTPRPAAVLFLDIAGFTEITDRFAQQAEFGAEQLSELLNDCFTTLIDVVDVFGGDIIAFTGDGFLAAWEAGDRERATHVAAQCALALQHAMEVRAQSSDMLIRLRISIDVGTVYYCRLGGHEGVWRYAVVGAPFENLGRAYREAAIGEIALCESAWCQLPMTAKAREPTAFLG